MFLTYQKAAPAARVLQFERMRVQLFLGVLFSVVIPLVSVALAKYDEHPTITSGITNSAIIALIAVVLAVTLYRRVTSFPGIRAFRFVIPTYAGAFGLVLLAILLLRLEYNRPMLLMSFVLSLSIAFATNFYVLRRAIRRFYIVPFGRYEAAFSSSNTEWVIMDTPCIPDDREAIIVADFRYDHEQAWEQMLAHAAVAGHVVYHVKQLRESLTGRVSIEHISENSFGSMLPNLAYRKIKRAVDLFSALVLLPILAIPLLIVAMLIKIDSPGPIIFRQERMGYRGRPFRIFKFRSMRVHHVAEDHARGAAMTVDDDPRITRLGRFLRRSRIDEVPQIFNIIAGDMSWIGPRPEAIPLSRWYEKEIPFYFYRHIVRPGITGWAQVNQGHVSDLDSVTTKLGYDFYYIKNFSAWIDLLITLRTVSTMLSGFGSK